LDDLNPVYQSTSETGDYHADVGAGMRHVVAEATTAFRSGMYGALGDTGSNICEVLDGTRPDRRAFVHDSLLVPLLDA
jgi:hypothetical protein